jgi:manganese/zinc/iron transport system permease protein
MLIGAGLTALLAIGLVELLRRVGRVEPATALGVVFTAFFAAGILLLELSGASGTSFDVHHALFGNLEGQVWPVAQSLASVLDPEALSALPPALGRLAVTLAIVATVIALGWKEFVLVAFDSDYATASGLGPRKIALAIAALTALVAVAAFEAVGVILVLAMLVSPAATGRMLTDRLPVQVAISLAVAAASAIGGYLLAAFGPALFGYSISLGAAGTIALVAALIQTAAMVFGPRRRRMLA